jgi:hypothetical protein
VETDVVSRILMTGVLLVQLVCAGVTWADARWIEGTYRNSALGYSIKIPHGCRHFMKTRHLVLLVFLSLNCSPASEARHSGRSPSAPPSAVLSVPPQEQVTAAPSANSKGVVYVSDFELHVINAIGSTSTGAPVISEAGSSNVPASDASRSQSRTTPQSGAAAGSKAGRSIWQETDLPQTRASKLVDFMSMSLLRALERAGYTARRSKAGEAPLERGVLLRGVFAESDEQNHIRLALFGSGSPASQFQLYLGVQNLARADQPLYEIANPNSPGLRPPEGKAPDNQYGPAITVTSYAPVAKFALDKEPTEEQVQKIATEIVASLTALLRANPAAGVE